MNRIPSFALLLALAAAAPASAQRLETYGFKFGPNTSTIQTDLPSEDPVRRHGVNAVLFAQLGLPGRLGLVTEAGYVERGYAREVSADPDVIMDDVYRLDRRMQYVTVAALARLDVARMGPASAYALAGPRMNALVGRRGEDTDNGIPGYGYRAVAWDFSAGAGVELVNGLPLLLEARYNVGLNDAFQGEGWRGTAYHRAVDVVVGLKF